MRFHSLTAALLFAGFAAGADAPTSTWTWEHKPGDSVTLRQDARVLWTFHYAAADNHPYFHPLATDQGEGLSDFAPPDHPWHRGLWFSWKFINGVNYWEKPYKGTSTISGPLALTTTPSTATMDLTVEYATKGQVVMREQRHLTATVPDAQGTYTIDWDMTFTALVPEVLLTRTPRPGEPDGKNYGGYAGLSFRSLGPLAWSSAAEPAATHGKTAPWLDASRVGDGHVLGGVTIFDHPENLRAPTPWYIGKQINLPFFQAAVLFNQSLTLKPAEPLHLRYRLLVHRGGADTTQLQAAYADWITPKK